MTNIEVRTQNIYENLSNAEKKVASYFLDNVENVFAKPISQLAEESGVSKVAWVRFCKAIGFDGLKDLKKSLFSELHETAGEPAEAAAFSDIREATGIDQLILSVKNNSIRAVRDTTKLLDPASVEGCRTPNPERPFRAHFRRRRVCSGWRGPVQQAAAHRQKRVLLP